MALESGSLRFLHHSNLRGKVSGPAIRDEQQGGGEGNLRQTVSDTTNLVGFISDGVSLVGEMDQATSGAVAELSLLEGMEVVPVVGTAVAVSMDFFSVGDALFQGNVPVSGTIGLSAFGLSLSLAPEFAIPVAGIGAFLSFTIQDPTMAEVGAALYYGQTLRPHFQP